MAVSAQDVKTLRERTQAGMMDCKKALTEAGGDMEKAIEILRQSGLAAAAKKAGREAAEGTVEAYIHPGGKVGVLVEINCETDFVAKTDEFKNLVRDIAMQIAAMAPEYVQQEDVPAEVIDKERAIYAAQAAQEGKPEHVVTKMVEGRLNKYYSQACLLEQEFIKDESGKPRKVKDLVTEAIARLGENIVVRRFARFKIGEAS